MKLYWLFLGLEFGLWNALFLRGVLALTHLSLLERQSKSVSHPTNKYYHFQKKKKKLIFEGIFFFAGEVQENASDRDSMWVKNWAAYLTSIPQMDTMAVN